MVVGGEDGDEAVPWQVHLLPVIHVEVDADGALNAQMAAQTQVVDELQATDLDVEELRLEDMHVDAQSMMDELMGDDDSGLDDIGLADDSELPDVDNVTSMDELLDDDADDGETDAA